MSTPVIEKVNVIHPTVDNSFMEELFPYEEPSNKNIKTHIINPPMNKHVNLGEDAMPQDIVDSARLNGIEIVALCGYTWVPKHNPEKFDICKECMEIAQQMIGEEG